MFKRNLAIKPREEREPEPQLGLEGLNPQEQWVQEEEKLRNERRVYEPIQEKIERLVPGFHKKFYL